MIKSLVIKKSATKITMHPVTTAEVVVIPTPSVPPLALIPLKQAIETTRNPKNTLFIKLSIISFITNVYKSDRIYKCASMFNSYTAIISPPYIPTNNSKNCQKGCGNDSR